VTKVRVATRGGRFDTRPAVIRPPIAAGDSQSGGEERISMLSRLRSTLFASAGALILALSASGLVAAAALVGDTGPTTDGTVTTPVATDTSATFEDLNGDGIDDDCQTGVVADQAAADAALKAADTDGDGTISVSEAAHTDWVGGANCNHGGYVSGVARASGEDCSGGTPEGSDQGSGAGTVVGTTLVKSGDDQDSNSDENAGDAAESESDQGDCSSTTQQTTTDAPRSPADCQATAPEAPTTGDQGPTDTSPNAHGVAVSIVAHSGAVGGKNCNHGGAVSEAAKKDHGADVHGNAGKQHGNAGKQHGKGHGKGHANP
jgi:hypothetical protein